MLDNIGENRLPTFQNLDLHLERPITFGTTLTSCRRSTSSTSPTTTPIQAMRGNQNASNANNIQAIVAPRVLRFGVRVNW